MFGSFFILIILLFSEVYSFHALSPLKQARTSRFLRRQWPTPKAFLPSTSFSNNDYHLQSSTSPPPSRIISERPSINTTITSSSSNTDGLHWQAATPEDVPTIQSFIADVLSEYHLQLEVTDDDWHEIGRPNDEGGGGYVLFDVLVNDQQEIVGTVGLYRLNGVVWELRKMYLRRDYRGGLWGWRLLQRALTCARTSGGGACQRIVLELNGAFETAKRLYRAAGFRPYHPPAGLKFGSDRAYVLDLTTRAGNECPRKATNNATCAESRKH